MVKGIFMVNKLSTDVQSISQKREASIPENTATSFSMSIT